MKTTLLLGFVLMVVGAMAQPGGGRGGRGGGGGGRSQEGSTMLPEERQQRTLQQRQTRNEDLRTQLALSDSIASIVDGINARYDAQQDELFGKAPTPNTTSKEGAPSKDFNVMRTQMENINSARTTEIKSHLSTPQQEQYDKYLKAQESKRPQGRR
jgi:hypothetical protein